MILVSRAILDSIRRHGRDTYPEECCGALLGSNGGGPASIRRVEPLANARSDERRRRFRIEPAEYRRMEEAADASGVDLLGFYHSHPDHPATPSEYDRDHALPFFHYLVLAVSGGAPGEITSWVLSEDRASFERETLDITDRE